MFKNNQIAITPATKDFDKEFLALLNDLGFKYLSGHSLLEDIEWKFSFDEVCYFSYNHGIGMGLLEDYDRVPVITYGELMGLN